MTIVSDLPVLDLDPRTELVRLAEHVRLAEPVQALDPIRRWIVVMGDPKLEWQLGHAVDRLGRDPRQRSDRRLDTHAPNL
jgi:hypothetical protein